MWTNVLSSVQSPVSAQGGIIAFGKTRSSSTPSLSSLPKTALDTVSMLVRLSTYRFQLPRMYRRPLPFSTLFSSGDVCCDALACPCSQSSWNLQIPLPCQTVDQLCLLCLLVYTQTSQLFQSCTRLCAEIDYLQDWKLNCWVSRSFLMRIGRWLNGPRDLVSCFGNRLFAEVTVFCNSLSISFWCAFGLCQLIFVCSKFLISAIFPTQNERMTILETVPKSTDARWFSLHQDHL